MKIKMKKSMVIALLGLSVLMLAGGVYAFWGQTSKIENPFDTGRYGSMIREDFNPSDGENWQPGATVEKRVTVNNTGSNALIVRVKLDEKWTRQADAAAQAGVTYKDSAAAIAAHRHDAYTAYQADAGDGLTKDDESVVEKNFSASENWIKSNDGWYYYKVKLPAGEPTDAWLESVTFLAEADMGKFETKKYVSASLGDESAWVWVEYENQMPKYLNESGPCSPEAAGAQQVLRNKVETTYAASAEEGLLGYSQSDYTLTVTAQTVQATKEALDAVFGEGSNFKFPTDVDWGFRENIND
jgi:alternate signal-mediated exported protein